MPLHVPAEHDHHAACWLAAPYRQDEWVDLIAAQHEHEALVLAIAETERVELLTRQPSAAELAHPNVHIHDLPYGDSWTRDTGPVFAILEDRLLALSFRFDGWGGKYLMNGDADLSEAIANVVGVPLRSFDFVLEGGAVEFDGEGTLLTTSCLGLPNRKPPADLREQVKRAFNVDHVIEIEGQLANDHTDGHIDTIARFVKPGEVVCMRGDADDPNGAMLLAIQEQLLGAADISGRPLSVHTIPSPGVVRGTDGDLLAASYCNYYLANERVIVPQYGVPNDEAALAAIGELFPERRVCGLSSRAIIEGGGSFHCITQQQPSL
jgi:agmatine deiminase